MARIVDALGVDGRLEEDRRDDRRDDEEEDEDGFARPPLSPGPGRQRGRLLYGPGGSGQSGSRLLPDSPPTRKKATSFAAAPWSDVPAFAGTGNA